MSHHLNQPPARTGLGPWASLALMAGFVLAVATVVALAFLLTADRPAEPTRQGLIPAASDAVTTAVYEARLARYAG